MEALADAARQLATKAQGYGGSKTSRLPITAASLRDWKYRDRLPDDAEIDRILGEEGFDSLKIKLFFKPHASRGGQWHEGKRLLELDLLVFSRRLGGGSVIPLTVGEFREGVDRLKLVARHEMQHVGQTLFQLLTGASELRGLPSRQIRDPKRDPSGFPRDPRYEQRRVDHALRDVEFYTDLQDEIDAFVSLAPRIPPEGRREALNAWTASGPVIPQSRYGFPIGASSYFLSLFHRSRPKWRKAVGEFVKAVNKQVEIPGSSRLGADPREAG